MQILPFTRVIYYVLALLLCSQNAFAEIPKRITELPLHEWRGISSNTIADLDPCPNRDCAWSGSEGLVALVDAWNGGVYASKLGKLGSLVYAGGGHNSYYGNEVYAFDLQTLAWERRNTPTDGKITGDPSTMFLDENCRFWDNSPVVPHTYDSVVYDPETNRFIMLTPSDAPSHILPGRGNGCNSTTPAYFDFSVNAWRNMKSKGPADLTDAPTAYDSKRKLFWGRTGFRDPRLFVSYNPAKDQWEQYEDEPINIDSVGAIDPTRDIFVALDFAYPPPKIGVFDLSRPSKGVTYINTIGDKEIEASAGLGFEWANKLNAFVAWNNGPDIFLLTPPKDNWNKEDWVWTRISAKGTDPGIAINGARSKFQWIDALGIAVIAPSINSPVYAVRLAK